jgi:DNA mismatch repair ATPase MutS
MDQQNTFFIFYIYCITFEKRVTNLIVHRLGIGQYRMFYRHIWKNHDSVITKYKFVLVIKRVLSNTRYIRKSIPDKSQAELIITANELMDIKIVNSKSNNKTGIKDIAVDLKSNNVSSKKSAKTRRSNKSKKDHQILASMPSYENQETLSNARKTDLGVNERSTTDILIDRGSITDNNTFTDFYQNIIDTYKTYSDLKDGEYIVLFHVGSFYELYFEQADKYSNMLGLTLTKKSLKSGPISFSGFPDKMLEKYMDIIYKAGLKAVICNQILDPVTNTLSRPVDRIMTPGTIVDESCRDFHRNNYLMAISFPDDFKLDVGVKNIGVAWCDVNLGLFYVSEIELSQLLLTITRINPAEILISDKVDLDKILSGAILPELVDLKLYYVTHYHQSSKKKSLDEFVWRFSDNKRLVSTTFDKLSQKEKNATSFLLHYLEKCLPNYRTSFQLPTRSIPKTLMQIDARAAQDLELLETLQSRKRVGALSHLIDKTITSPGARLLNTWLLAPSTDLNKITKRHALLNVFLKDIYFLDSLSQLLRKTADINRIIRRIDNTKADVYEYLELAMTIDILDEIYNLAQQSQNNQAMKLIDPIFDEFNKSKEIHLLAKQIQRTIDPKVSYLKSTNNKLDGDFIREFWDIKETASISLKKLRTEYDVLVENSKKLKTQLQQQFLAEGYGGSLRLVKDLKTYAYVVELKSTSKVIPSMVQNLKLQVKEKSKSVTKLTNEKWSEIGEKLVKLEYDILIEEERIMKELNTKIMNLYKELRRLSPIIEVLDVIQSFANLALQYNLSRPTMDESTMFKVKNGRHIVVEEGLKNRIDMVNFTVNSCDIKSSEAWVITGPNMGGKSTFLRQNALIAILAQIGSYVPADEAHIGIVDKIFTRVGSSDNIFKHQSTFMVEMNETAVILREATERSLVIVDELGRGTSTNEGVSIAYATLFRLLTVNKSKILFATHFGAELMSLIESYQSIDDCISFYKTSLAKTNDDKSKSIDQKIVFDHKLTRGISLHSHALQIAELAGFPKDVLELAKENFEKLNS